MSTDAILLKGALTSDGVVHDIPDRERPETWIWRPTITFRSEGSDPLTDPAEIRKAWNEKSETLTEPFRSALLSLPDDAVIWCERLSQWPTIEWDNKNGSVTLAGDAAHPMTYRKHDRLSRLSDSSFWLEMTNILEQIEVKGLTTPSTTPLIWAVR